MKGLSSARAKDFVLLCLVRAHFGTWVMSGRVAYSDGLAREMLVKLEAYKPFFNVSFRDKFKERVIKLIMLRKVTAFTYGIFTSRVEDRMRRGLI